MRLPIFQLTWGFRNEDFGLMFPSEIKYDSQEFSFFIALPIGYNGRRRSNERISLMLQRNRFYFPAEIDGKYTEIEGKVRLANNEKSYDTITFEIESGNEVEFKIDPFVLRSFFRAKGIHTKYLNKYIGKDQKLIYDQYVFIPLVIYDFKQLNEFFIKKKGILVGYTNDFGILDDTDLQ